MKSTFDFLSRGGELGALTRAFDWSSTPLGPPEQWPETLKTTVRLVLTSNHPMFIWWGPELIQFYNDAYRQTMGPERHPSALGQRGRDCWEEIWPIIGPQIESIMAGGEATWHEDQLIPVTRHGRRENVWWTYGYSPIEDSRGVHGVLVICKDVTAEHLARAELSRLIDELAAEVHQREQMERQQAFQLALSDKMSAFSDPEKIASVAFEMLSRQLGLTRAHFVDIDHDNETFQVNYAWNLPGTPSTKGVSGTLSEFGTELIQPLLANETVAVSDVTEDTRVARRRAHFAALGIRAALIVPIVKDGRLAGLLSLHKQHTYEWKNHEAALLKEVADRIWNAIEHARIETLKQQTHQALLQHQKAETEHLRQLFQQAPSFVAVLNGPEHRYEIANDAYLQLTGFRQIVGKTVREALPELEGQGYFELLDEVYAAGKPYSAQGSPVKLRRKQNAELDEMFLDFVYQPIFDTDGKVSGIFVEGSNVTEQCYAERRLQFLLQLADMLRPLSTPEAIVSAASELLGSHLGVARVLFAEVDASGTAYVVRRDWVAKGVKSASGTSGKLENFGPEIIDALRKGHAVTVNDVTADPRNIEHVPTYEMLSIRSHLAIPLVKNGRLEAILCVHREKAHSWTDHESKIAHDMAERTWDAVESARAQAELSIVRDQSAYVFNSMVEGFGVVDRDWTIVQMNAEGLRINQMKAEEIIGRNHWDVFPGLKGTETEAAYNRVKTSGVAETVELFYTYPDGKRVWMEIRIHPALNGGLGFFFRDVSRRKEVEQKLVEADRRKDEFLAMLAHELRNPLAPISAAADLLQLAQLDRESIMQTSDVIARQVRHMTSLVNDLMDVSRVTRGLITLDNKTLDAANIVADAVEQVRPLIDARRHRLAVHLPQEPAFVQGDQKRLVQVIANVLSNAAKYTQDGGLITLNVSVDEGHVVFSVSDDGIGMTPETVNHVFELFAQAQRSSDRSLGGLGIGLALVKSLVELHGGNVIAESMGLGKGSRFAIRLPRASSAVGTPPASTEAFRLTSPRRLRLLVVDDNADAAHMLAMFLETAGHDILVEHHPRAALERARIEAPDVCLLDIGLPDMDGNELARQLRSLPGTAKAVLIAVTGYGQEQDRKNSLAAGFDYHFVKPVDTEELASLLATLSNLSEV